MNVQVVEFCNIWLTIQNDTLHAVAFAAGSTQDLFCSLLSILGKLMGSTSSLTISLYLSVQNPRYLVHCRKGLETSVTMAIS